MRLHSYKSLATPIAQIAAAEEFCASIRAYFKDEYEGDADTHDINVTTVLDRLACLGVRFETDGNDYEENGNSYFVWDPERQGVLGECLHAYAALVAKDFEENKLIDYGDSEDDDDSPSMVQVVTLHGCVLDNLIFVPDFEGVTSPAYFLALMPGRLPEKGQ